MTLDKRTIYFDICQKLHIFPIFRFFPIYGFLILFNATYLFKLQDAAHWQRIGGLERQYCRKNWWANILYQNRGYDLSQMVII